MTRINDCVNISDRSQGRKGSDGGKMKNDRGLIRADMEKILQEILSGIKENPRRSGNYEIFGKRLNINEPDQNIERVVSKVELPEYEGDIDKNKQKILKNIVSSLSGLAGRAERALCLTDWKYGALERYLSQKDEDKIIRTSAERRAEWLKCSLREIICRFSEVLSKESAREEYGGLAAEQLIAAIHMSAKLRGMRHMHMSQIEADEFFLKELYHAVPLPKLPESATVHISEKQIPTAAKSAEAIKSGKTGKAFAGSESNLVRKCAQTGGKVKKSETENYRKILITEHEIPEIKRDKTMEQKMRRMYTDEMFKEHVMGFVDGSGAAPVKAEFLPALSPRRYKEISGAVGGKKEKQSTRGKV